MERFVVKETVKGVAARILDWSAIGSELTELGSMGGDVQSDPGGWASGRSSIRDCRGVGWGKQL